MARFKYTAIDAKGKTVSGEYNSMSREGVIEMLKANSCVQTSITQISDEDARVTKKNVAIKVMAGACQQLAAMINAGIPVADALGILAKQTEDKILKSILDDVVLKIQQGATLTEGFKAYEKNFPSIFIHMLEAGEVSGQLGDCLNRAADTLMKSSKLKNKVKSAMTYPIILLVLTVGVVTMLMIGVIPQFVSLFDSLGGELPFLTQMLITLSGVFVNFWYLLLGGLIGIIFGAKTWMATPGGRGLVDNTILKIPKIKGLLKVIYAARYARTLSSLQAVGVALPKALTVTAKTVGNMTIEKHLVGAVDAIHRGESLSSQLDGFEHLPLMILYLTKVGESSGSMDTLLAQAADFYDNEAETAMTQLTLMLEPAMIVVMAGIVVPIIFAIIQPMFAMYEQLM